MKKYDVIALNVSETDKVQAVLAHGMEPFSVTTNPKMNPLTRDVEVGHIMWFRGIEGEYKPLPIGEQKTDLTLDKK